MYSSLRRAGHPAYRGPPFARRRQPHRERLGEVLVGMALRVPRVEVKHVALAVRLRGVELRIGLGRRSKDVTPLAAAPQTVGVVDGMAGFVAQDAHAPLVLAALHLEHLRLLELLEPRMRQVERDRNRRRAVRREPLVGQIEVNGAAQALGGHLALKLGDAVGEPILDGDGEVAHAHVEQRLVRQVRPVWGNQRAGHAGDSF